MPKIKLLLSYDGTDYCGWQRQREHRFASELPSLQETVETALKKIFQHPISLSASGRTDAGVHALAQVANFDTERPLPKDLCWALRGHLPASIVVKDAWIAPADFHSTISAEKKTYRYFIWNNNRSTAIFDRFSWWIRQPLNLDYLNACSEFLKSNQDFASFRSTGTDVSTTIREIYQAKWAKKSKSLICFEVTGNGFLKQMVRNIVGTIVDMALKDQPIEKMAEILAVKDRTKAGPAAPPQGLFLYKVYYPKELDKKCRRF